MPETNSLNIFANRFWFAPGDVFLRSIERVIWAKQSFKPPILDIGCGDAGISRILFKGHRKIDLGIDLDKAGIKKARQSNFYKKVMIVDAADMPFEAGSFQTVISNSTFEHIKNDLKSVAETSRVLKKGGRFFFTVPSKRLKNALEAIIKDKNKVNILNQRLSHWHYRDLNQWTDILQKHGLIVETYQYYFPKPAVKIWYRLFRIATFRPYRREFWSYLKDSPYGRLFPKRLIAKIIVQYLRPFLPQIFDRSGCWLFIVAKKS